MPPHSRHASQPWLRGRSLRVDQGRHLRAIPGGNADETTDARRRASPADEPRQAERILATVVFTDIVASTAHAVALGDERWRQLLGRHDAILREELGSTEGRVIKTTGDGFLVAFPTPSPAVRWAAVVQGAVAPLGVRLRSGVHAGECVPGDRELTGIAVHVGARICALADPGEVLVSRTVRDLTIGSELRFRDRGMHALRGVPDPWRLYALDKTTGAQPDAGK